LEHFGFTLRQEFTKMLARAFLKSLYWKWWFEILECIRVLVINIAYTYISLLSYLPKVIA
jgi:hypothetical protein